MESRIKENLKLMRGVETGIAQRLSMQRVAQAKKLKVFTGRGRDECPPRGANTSPLLRALAPLYQYAVGVS